MAATVEYAIRRARLEDLRKICRLERMVWKEMAATHRQMRRRFLLHPAGFLLAAIGAEIGGFCIAVLLARDARQVGVDETFPPEHIPKGRYYVMYALTVSPLFRRRGIASSLVRKHLERARRLRCRKVQLVANAFSRPVFERLGFEAVDSLDQLFSSFPDLMPQAVLMERAP